jgi:REP element-mobilizing transposase RayT
VRQSIFRDESDCARFLKLLEESAQRFKAAILCFVLMGNHFHSVAQTHQPNLRRWMLITQLMKMCWDTVIQSYMDAGPYLETYWTRSFVPDC